MSTTVGELAPDFELRDQTGATVKLSDFRGEKNVVLIFFTAAFTGICDGELCTIRDEFADLDSGDAQVLAVSTDTGPTLREWADQKGYKFRLLSDFWPHGAVADSYGVFDPQRGLSLRGTFVIDKAGTIRWQVVNAIPDARNAADYRTALAAL
ncbi:MAG TPA: peroxiredoxin [Pseudonocardiaceae bacterium]|nr:peroxiredoxin [Pseudonocardiaceae bacterium]